MLLQVTFNFQVINNSIMYEKKANCELYEENIIN